MATGKCGAGLHRSVKPGLLSFPYSCACTLCSRLFSMYAVSYSYSRLPALWFYYAEAMDITSGHSWLIML
jgi:hypothetical protein